MAEKDMSEATDDHVEDDALRRRLLSRIAVAGVAIVGLLGGLAIFDSLNKPDAAPELPKMAAAPAEPVDEKKVVPEEKAEAKPEEPQKTETAVPEKSETPVAPTVAEKPQKLAKPVTPPATGRPAAVRPSEPTPPVAKLDTRREIARVMPEPRPDRGAAPPHAPASRPLTQVAETARRLLVQVGVFSNHANAEELVHKLTEAGIPARIESHVQIGPFASRAEADAARGKLRSMGLDEGMLVRR